MKHWHNRIVSVGLQGGSPAYRQNDADLDPAYRDVYGNPLLRIIFNFTDNERKMVQYIADRAMGPIIATMNPAIQQVSDTIRDFSIVPHQSTHTFGGTIMGTDPTTSATNKHLQVWNVPNRFVVRASNVPQNDGYNPTGTVGALAYWAVNAIISKHLKSPKMLA